MTDAAQASVRPMRAGDVDSAATLSLAAFGRPSDDPEVLRVWHRRLRHCLERDPDGAFVAEHRRRVVGVAQAIRREGTWVLSLLAVDPAAQGGGLGRGLLAAALDYAAADDAGLIMSSSDPRALAAYGAAGFALLPTFEARGAIELQRRPAALPDASDGSGNLAALGAIAREVRGATHEFELPLALDRGAGILQLADRGFAVAQRGHGVWMLAARDEQAATALLWHALEVVGELDGGRAALRWITGDQQWAIAVALAAGLRLVPYGAVCARRVSAPLYPYIPSGTFA